MISREKNPGPLGADCLPDFTADNISWRAGDRQMKKGKGRWIVLMATVLVICIMTAIFYQRSSPDLGHVSNADEISEAIRGAMIRRSWRVRVSFKTGSSDRDRAQSLLEDIIEGAFYESDDPKGGDYLRFQYGGYEMTQSMKKGLFRYSYQAGIVPSYYTSADQEAAVDQEVERIIRDLSPGRDASDYDKIRWVHDYICQTASYDDVHKHTAGSGHIQSTAYGVLVYHTALCQGYAVSCYRLLKELGADVRIVTGKALTGDKMERHAWNIVRVGEAYYNLDITMDDVSGTEDGFLKSDRTFAGSYIKDEQYCTPAFLKACPMSEEDYSYE